MLQWRLKIREARQALKDGRYEEAYGVLSDDELRDFLPAKQLAGELAAKYADRAAQRIAWGQSSAGFADLAAVDKLGAGQQQADQIRRDYTQKAEREVIARLAAEEPRSALLIVERARRRDVDSPGLRALSEIAQGWSHAVEQADAGQMSQAVTSLQTVARAAKAGGPWDTIGLSQTLTAAQDALAELATEHAAASERLHTAAIAKDWPEVLRAAEEAIKLAPRDQAVVTLRRRAWRELEFDRTRPYRENPRRDERSEKMNGHDQPSEARRLARAIRDTTAKPPRSKEDTAIGAAPANRRMLWVDAVGGFLVCLDDEVVLGQPSGGAAPTAPILADISRRHAVLRRDQGSYVLEPIGPTKLDGSEITGPTVLGNGHLIELGDSVRIRFARPHALSATARLTIESGHRTTPSADAILLMAESCVLGSGSHSHVRCRDWEQDVILFRQNDEILCRSAGQLNVDGQSTEGAASLADGTRIEGQDFAMCVELV